MRKLQMVDLKSQYEKIKVEVNASIQEVLDTNSLKYENGEITMYPATEIEITDIDTAKKLMKLYDDLEENEDVQEIYSNFDISDEVMNSIDN